MNPQIVLTRKPERYDTGTSQKDALYSYNFSQRQEIDEIYTIVRIIEYLERIQFRQKKTSKGSNTMDQDPNGINGINIAEQGQFIIHVLFITYTRDNKTF